MQLCVRGPTAKRFHYFGKTRYTFQQTGLQQFLYQFRVGESPCRLLKPAQYTYFGKYIGGGGMLSTGDKKKKKQIHSFPRKLAALNSENRKGLWKCLLRALLSTFWVYTCVKWKVDFFGVCVKLQIYFLHAGKNEYISLFNRNVLCMRAFYISYKWYRALVPKFSFWFQLPATPKNLTPHPTTAVGLQAKKLAVLKQLLKQAWETRIKRNFHVFNLKKSSYQGNPREWK